MSRVWPGSLLARTALLIAGTLSFFCLVVWAGLVWTTLIPAADVTAHVLSQRVQAAVKAYHAGSPLPAGVEIAASPSPSDARSRRDLYLSLYLSHLRRQLQTDLPGSEVVVVRGVLPTQIRVRLPGELPQEFVLSWQVARPETPVAMGALVLLGALVALSGAALFARRLTAPLADLARAAQAIARGAIARGETVAVDVSRGPAEVRALAAAFQSMSTRLREIDEQRELMLAGLSHDLRSPLARVRVAVELVADDPSQVQQITLDIEEMDRIIGQFLHYLRAGYREQPVPGCPDDIVRECLHPYLPGGDLRTDLKAGEPRLLAVSAVRRIVSNLVQNALEYGRPPVTIRSALRSPSELWICVEDAGPGLSPQEWQEAVRPFQRLRATPGTGHSGLGLATVERLVHACQGSLSSRRTEGGFAVDVTLCASSVPEVTV